MRILRIFSDKIVQKVNFGRKMRKSEIQFFYSAPQTSLETTGGEVYTRYQSRKNTLVPLHRRSLEDYGEIMEIITILNLFSTESAHTEINNSE